jgi:hypothetical protein
VAVAVVVLSRPDSAWLRSGGRSLLPPPAPSQLATEARHPVEARSIRVQSVVTPTGFWVGTSQRTRLFVELLGTPPFPVSVGQKLSFVGFLDPNHEGSGERFRLSDQDAVQLREQGSHIDVQANALRRG